MSRRGRSLPRCPQRAVVVGSYQAWMGFEATPDRIGEASVSFTSRFSAAY
jgi:hypothetical protein